MIDIHWIAVCGKKRDFIEEREHNNWLHRRRRCNQLLIVEIIPAVILALGCHPGRIFSHDSTDLNVNEDSHPKDPVTGWNDKSNLHITL